ncbi:MAG TPA: hypothetical protein PKZ56_02820 [Candidatus Paceibacterota bacterium]|nr:hypothetical protein [Candidatus Paceibacterota bacterium]
MKDFWTWRKVALFLGIIGLGIMGLVFADQQDFLSGRANSQSAIGNGEADPLAEDANLLPIKTKAGTSAVIEKPGTKKTTIPTTKQQLEIDGINPVSKPKK